MGFFDGAWIMFELYGRVVAKFVNYAELALHDGLTLVLAAELVLGFAQALFDLQEAARLHMCLTGNDRLKHSFGRARRKVDR